MLVCKSRNAALLVVASPLHYSFVLLDERAFLAMYPKLLTAKSQFCAGNCIHVCKDNSK